jgi:hypothetical protein
VKHFLKIGETDVKPLNAEIAAHPELWDQVTLRKTAPGTPHRAMSDIWVRYNDVKPFLAKGDLSTFNDRHVPIWYPAWRALPALRPIVFGLMARVEGEMIGGVLITRIPPGGGIEPHTDRGWHVDYYEKFYVALQSEPGALFLCQHGGEREALNPAPGEIHLFDNRKEHWVDNRSDQDRVTLIVCIRTSLFGREG